MHDTLRLVRVVATIAMAMVGLVVAAPETCAQVRAPTPSLADELRAVLTGVGP